jgi:glycosyltransferase involved in cell wall biosynthesis
MTPRRVLVISYLPPTPGGIATWAGILRIGASNARRRFLFERVGGPRSVDHGRLVVKILHAIRLVVGVTRRLVLSRPELVHVNCCIFPPGLWRDLTVASLVRMCRVPLVVHYRGSLPDVMDRLSPRSRLALRGLMRMASVNIAVTRASEALLKSQCPASRSAYLPNFVEDEWRDRTAVEAEAGNGARPRAVYAGRLSVDKGTIDLLDAARRLPHVDFVLMGEVSKEVRRAVEAAPANVIATGHLARDEVLERFLESDLLVFPSHREGSPNAVLEAMAAGLPVVSTRVGGLPELIDDRGGYLVSPAAVEELTDAVGRLVADRECARRMGRHNRRICLENFSFSVVFESLSTIYDEIVSAKADGATSKAVSRPAKEASRRPSHAGEAER